MLVAMFCVTVKNDKKKKKTYPSTKWLNGLFRSRVWTIMQRLKRNEVSLNTDRETGRTMHILWAKFMFHKTHICVDLYMCVYKNI